MITLAVREGQTAVLEVAEVEVFWLADVALAETAVSPLKKETYRRCLNMAGRNIEQRKTCNQEVAASRRPKRTQQTDQCGEEFE